MMSYFFTPREPTKKELIQLTLKNFYPFPTCEVEILFRITKDMLSHSDENAPDFDEHFNKILFGTMITAMVIESRKYGYNLYPVKHEAAYDCVAVLLNLYNRESMQQLILTIGSKMLAGELPLSPLQIDRCFPHLVKAVPSIKKRLPGAQINNTSDNKNLLENGEEARSFWRFCNII